MTPAPSTAPPAPSPGHHANSGMGPVLVPYDVGHPTHIAVIDPDTAMWALVRKSGLADALTGGALLDAAREAHAGLAAEMDLLRFGLQPSCVYFNATDRCNLDCGYCYIPRDLRRGGRHMEPAEVVDALERLQAYFATRLPPGKLPQVIFHGAEPLLNRRGIFPAIEQFAGVFRFGVQTNATLLDPEAIEFLTRHRVGIGLSLDAPDAATADEARPGASGGGSHASVVAALRMLRGYDGYSVICTITEHNVEQLSRMVEFFHEREVPACMLNVVRCTLPGARSVRADDDVAAEHFIAALERSHALYVETGRKLVVANFANILLAILAPTARRLMCDISPCGGGRSFFAVSANGDMFPCSEFIGLPRFRGGNLYTDPIDTVLGSPEFRAVTGRKVEDIEPCRHCVIRHFCGSACPAEAHELHGSMDRVGGYCGFYEEQARFAFRLIADGRADDFLWDGWREGTRPTFDLSQPSFATTSAT